MGIFNMRLDEEMKARWQFEADRRGMKLAELVKIAVEREIAEPSETARVKVLPGAVYKTEAHPDPKHKGPEPVRVKRRP